ncbi:MAG: ROK family protein [Fimbriimonadaceae bacterium]|nr:ROK family protein [Fimbriimonadaceae bacterium]
MSTEEITRWGIDLGGTKIAGVVLTGSDVTQARKWRIPTERELGYAHIIAQVGRLIAQMEADTGLRRPAQIGIGTPGTTDPATGRLKNSNTTVLNGQPFIADLSAAHGITFIGANDANCFAIAEATLGAAMGYETVFGIIMGTGVGGGLVVRGRVLNGAHGIAGEWGHNPLEPNGYHGYSGHRGVVESVLSGPALERYYADCRGESVRLPEIMLRADSGDLAAIQTRRRLLESFGRAVAQIVNIFDPHAIVLGGGVGQIAALYEHGPAEIAKHVFNPTFTTPLLAPKLGDDAGVFGAAMLVNP